MTKDTGFNQRGGLDGFYDALRRPGIARSSSGRWFGGVAAGLARWLGVDPLVIRAGFILFGMFFGMGFTLYLVLCLLMPDERGNLFIERALKHGEGWAIFLLVITAMSVLGGGSWGGNTSGLQIGGYVVLGALVWWFLTRTDTGRTVMASKPWAKPASTADGPDSTQSPGGDGMQRSTGNAAAAAGAALHSPEPFVSREPFVPRPVYNRTPSIGFAGGLLALGLAIVAGVVVSAVGLGGTWSGNYVSIAIAAGLGVLGLALVLAGFAGRRAGWIGGFAWFGICAAIFTSVVPANLTRPWQLGDQSYVVTSLEGAADYQLGVGQMSVNLT
ncbi:MAG: PspC domain-containing protein, partial [Dermatophilaceae bacterium]